MLLRDIFPDAQYKSLKKALYPQKFLRKVILKFDQSRYFVGSMSYYLGMLPEKDRMTPVDIYDFGVRQIAAIRQTRHNGHLISDEHIDNAVMMFTFLEVLAREKNFPHRARREADSVSIAFDDTARFLEILDGVSYTMRYFVLGVEEAEPKDIADLKAGKEKKPRTTKHKYRVMLTGSFKPEESERALTFFSQYHGAQMDVPAAFLHKLKACADGQRYVWLHGKTVFISDLRMLDILALAGVRFTKVIELT